MNTSRQKLVNAVLFFAKETSHLNITKLMKLLNFFDFEHFAETGYPSLGLEYYTFQHGPVPKDFWVEVKDGNAPDDLKDKIVIRIKPGEQGEKETEFIAKPGAQVNFRIFTPREKKILEKLAFIYKDATAKTMSGISHEDNMPWEITMREKGKNALIDYCLALNEKSPIDSEEATENLQDFFAFINTFDAKPTK